MLAHAVLSCACFYNLSVKDEQKMNAIWPGMGCDVFPEASASFFVKKEAKKLFDPS
jgi:hypothetical protein